jgi:hypothetical protein
MRRGRTTTHQNARQLPLRFGRGRGVRVAPPHSASPGGPKVELPAQPYRHFKCF